MQDILIVDDELIIRKALRRLLERHHYSVSDAATVAEALEQMASVCFDLVISDLRLPGAPGTDLIKPAGDTPVLIMTSYASLRSAVDAMKMGAVDYIAKPFDHDDMLAAIADTIRCSSKRSKQCQAPDTNRASSPTPPGFVGGCADMQKLYKQISRFAPTNTTILVQGETGTGKELVAQSLHATSLRANQPLISINCAAIPETLIESELFGYEKGAFTGATSNRMGLIEAASGGTLFLDEIGELPLEAQARLLRFLQEGEIRAIGSVQTRKVDVRLIAATHRDLKRLTSEGQFREDLYYRINVMQLNLPPLRDRGKDILEIAEFCLEHCCLQYGGKSMVFSAKAVQAITSYRWPGNVRELHNAVERAVILCDGDEIDYELLDIDIDLIRVSRRTNTLVGEPLRSVALADEPTENLSLEDYFQRFVLEHQDSMSETELARKLGVSRKCLWERRQRLGIPRKKNAKTSQHSGNG